MLLSGPQPGSPLANLRDHCGLLPRRCMLQLLLEATDLRFRLGDLASDCRAVGMLGGLHGDGEPSRNLGGDRDLQLFALVGVALTGCQDGAEVDRRPDRLVDFIDHNPFAGQTGRDPRGLALVGVDPKPGFHLEVVLGNGGRDPDRGHPSGG